MTTLFRRLLGTSHLTIFKRNLNVSSSCLSYEGDGKTTVTILNKNFDYGLMIDSVSERGFVLNNCMRIVGPMIMFPKTMLSWNVASSPEMTEESLCLFLNLEPKLDILVIGLDDEYPYNAPFLQNLRELFKRHKIPTEILPVYHACSVFNFVNSENRYAAAALIPPKLKRRETLMGISDSKLDKIPIRDPRTFMSDDPHAPVTMPEDEDPLEYNAEDLRKNKNLVKPFKTRIPWKMEDRIVHQSEPSDGKKKN
ncbi:hypothetical protein QAD02_019485 [Eretmocerus hayati]|uniref:Uncharacterized protein n=1 Tax=Eretmocerus hayati TaxID=131215 RepID=A0ACC2PJQ5_9HYME|nr:hypothetical protein QAD02_019485 [Eretmocerus hayati]